jgi:acyl-coenzyme A thioesterase PaaI-like protein
MKPNLLKLLRRMRFLSEKRRLEWYPPFWLMRVRVLELTDNWRRVRLLLPLNMLSRNMGDCMFGGYQAALSDPVAALACAKRFPGNEVWTRVHEVDFRHVGNSDLELRFEFPLELEQQIRDELQDKGRSTPTFEYGFYRNDGICCTRIRSTVAIRPEGYLRDK